MRSALGRRRPRLASVRSKAPVARCRITTRRAGAPASRSSNACSSPDWPTRSPFASRPSARSICSAVAGPTRAEHGAAEPGARGERRGRGVRGHPGDGFELPLAGAERGVPERDHGDVAPTPAVADPARERAGVGVHDRGDRRGRLVRVAHAVGVDGDVHDGPVGDQRTSRAVEDRRAARPLDARAEPGLAVEPRMDGPLAPADAPARLGRDGGERDLVLERAEARDVPPDAHAGVLGVLRGVPLGHPRAHRGAVEARAVLPQRASGPRRRVGERRGGPVVAARPCRQVAVDRRGAGLAVAAAVRHQDRGTGAGDDGEHDDHGDDLEAHPASEAAVRDALNTGCDLH